MQAPPTGPFRRDLAVDPLVEAGIGDDGQEDEDVNISQPETDHYLGKTFGGYRLEAKVGQGGMGTVYKGRQVSLDRVVAVKILNKALYENREFIKRFEREAKSIAKINHPNIVAVYDFGVHDGLWYMVNEFVEGQSLSKHIGDRLVVPLNEVVMYMVHCLAGLAHVSQGNIVHRDIKPDNILITRDGIAKIADFGLAKDVSERADSTDLTAVGLAMGTPAYMSPEQCMGRKLDGRSDQYSLGVTAYFALTGEKPFTGQSSFEIMTRQREHMPPTPKQLNPSLPADISAIVMRMLAKDPGDRYPDAGICGEAWLEAGTAHGCFGSVRRSGEFDIGMLGATPQNNAPPGNKSSRMRSDGAPPVQLPEVQMPPPVPPAPPPAPAAASSGRVYDRQPSIELRMQPEPADKPTRRPATDAPAPPPGPTRAPGVGADPRPGDKPSSERHRQNPAPGTAPAAITCGRCGHLNRPEAVTCTRCSAPLRETPAGSARDQEAEAQRLADNGRHREAAAIFSRLADKETDKRQKSILRAKEREARQVESERQVADFAARARSLTERGDLSGAIAVLEQGQRLLGESSAASAMGDGPYQVLAAEIALLRGRLAGRRRAVVLLAIGVAVVLAAGIAGFLFLKARQAEAHAPTVSR